MAQYLIKIISIIDHFSQQFQNHFYPFQNLYIDELLLFIQWQTEDEIIHSVFDNSETNFVLYFNFYVGTGTVTRDLGFNGFSNVVISHNEPLLGTGHTLYVDNSYSSSDLLVWLYNWAKNACRTVRKAKVNMHVMEGKLKEGEIAQRPVKGKLIAMKWCDIRKKCVVAPFNFHSAEIVENNKT